ncbi:MAG: glutamine synthetase family protein, partial [Pseudomonadota bacterium]
TSPAMSPAEIDIVLKPDTRTVRVVPWAAEPTAQVIHDCFYSDGRRVTMAPRHVLRRMLELYADRGWRPVVAPELEFYLIEPNIDADYPLKPPVGRSGRAEPGRQSYSIAAVNEFDPLFDDIYAFCEAQDIEIDTLIHEDGPAQMEINLLHGDPLDLADQVFLFKRTAREAALRHKMYATFMAKPHGREPGSAMHIHQSIVDSQTGRNVFSNEDGSPSQLFFAHIAGLQKYLPAAMALFAPNVNSYRRITRDQVAPINVQWGYDNRTAGLRVPVSGPEARRVENRVGGADANPYLAIAASLACGYLGMVENLKPTEPIAGSAHDLPFSLPRSLDQALRNLRECNELIQLLGEAFISAYTIVKEAESEVFLQVISSWEREHLLLNV